MSSAWRETLQHGLGAAYHIRQELGGGGMSETFIAEETALGRTVVLKVLSPSLTAGLDVERFQREIHLAARLQHAFIVPLLAAGVTDGQPWYTMPLVQGESLRARITREGPLPAAAAARILRDVCEALAHAHSHGVVHRDIKPDNILLSGAHAMVTDFGVAKALSASGSNSATMTGAGMAIGTPAYMAPEQAMGDPTTDHRADLYAVGATAFEMVTGRQLFAGRSPVQIIAAHATEQPQRIETILPSCPRDLAALVDQLLAKHPNDRPMHAQDVADALARMLTRWTSGEVTPASRVTFASALAYWGAAFVGVVGGAWLAVRFLPIPAWTFPAALVVMIATLPMLALTAWLHRRPRPISPVPSVASTTTMGRIEAIARPHLTWRRARRFATVAVGGLVLIAAGWAASRALGIGPAATLRAQGRVAATDRVLVADFDSPANDTTLGGVVANLLRTEIARSRSIRLVSGNERDIALVAMDKPTTTRVGSALARDVSERANAKAHLVGSVTLLGRNYLLRAVLVATATGEELASFGESAHGTDDIIGAVDRLGREIRDRLGASVSEIRGAPPLSFAVTPSLEAAKLYTRGIALAQAGDQPSATHALEQAVQVDTQFAMAYRAMSSFYGNLGNVERAAWAGERAFRYREKLPAVTQRLTEGTYYSSAASFDLNKVIASYEAAMELNPISATALNNLAHMLRRDRQFERSLAIYRQAVSRDSGSAFASTNIVSMMWATGRKAEAIQYVQSTLPRRMPRSRALITTQARLAFAELRPDSAERVIDNALRTIPELSPTQRAQLYVDLAAAQRERGRVAAAQGSMTKALALNPALDTVGSVPTSMLYRAELAAWDRERPDVGRRVLDSAIAKHPPGNASALGYRWIEVAGTYALAGDAKKAASFLARFDALATPNIKAFFKQETELARGWTAIAEKRYADAITAFRAADVQLCTVCALPPLAHAYDLANQPDSAIAVFERYLGESYFYRSTTDQAFLGGTYKRLAELYDAKGDAAKAQTYYARLIDLWKDADAELQPKVEEARRNVERLRRQEKR